MTYEVEQCPPGTMDKKTALLACRQTVFHGPSAGQFCYPPPQRQLYTPQQRASFRPAQPRNGPPTAAPVVKKAPLHFQIHRTLPGRRCCSPARSLACLLACRCVVHCLLFAYSSGLAQGAPIAHEKYVADKSRTSIQSTDVTGDAHGPRGRNSGGGRALRVLPQQPHQPIVYVYFF